MAIDTENKKRSASSMVPPIIVYPVPDGTITQADRQHVSFIYRGIAVATIEEFDIILNITSKAIIVLKIISIATIQLDMDSTADLEI